MVLAPTKLSQAEENALVQEIARCEGFHSNKQASIQRIQEQRAAMLCQSLYEQLLRYQDAPYLLRINLASTDTIPHPLGEALGVAITEPIGQVYDGVYSGLVNLQKGGYDVVDPQGEEQKTAQLNKQYLCMKPWGSSSAQKSLERVRYMVDGRESISAFRFPIDQGESLPGLMFHGHHLRPIPHEFSGIQTNEEKNRVLLGTNDYLGYPQEVYLSDRDRMQHMYIIGQTGTGKTTLLKTMILSDFQAGKGVAVIDPHGDLFDELIDLIPPSRQQDVVLFDPTDTEFPPGINLLECRDEEQRQFVVREMRAIMRRLVEDQYGRIAHEWTGPVFYRHMQMNMLLTMSDPENPGTLLEFYEIFQHQDYWRRWLPLKWSEPMLTHWVEKSLPCTDYPRRINPQEPSFGEYISSKFEDYVFDPRLRLIFGQRQSTIQIDKIMDEGKILLINLAKGKIGEANAQFLGMLLMAKIQSAVMARSKLEQKDRRPFYLYVDEFQSLATENFIILLSEARKFGLGIVLVNQFLSQIKDERIIQSIFGNVGTLLSFRIGRTDAEIIEPQFFPYFNKRDLANLPNWQACIRTTVHGKAIQPFSINTTLPEMEPSSQTGQVIRENSRQKYTMPKAAVEAIISQSLDSLPNQQVTSLQEKLSQQLSDLSRPPVDNAL